MIQFYEYLLFLNIQEFDIRDIEKNLFRICFETFRCENTCFEICAITLFNLSWQKKYLNPASLMNNVTGQTILKTVLKTEMAESVFVRKDI